MPTPITLTSPTEPVGRGFAPEAEEHAASGRLIFNPGEGLTLETISDLPLVSSRATLPIVLGITVDGRLVTLRLRNVFSITSNYHSPGGWSERSNVSTAFVGIHADSPS